MADTGTTALTTRAEESPLRIVVGISGGIAAYKAVLVVRELVLRGHDVHVVPTPSALRFVGAPTLEAISRNPVTTDIFDDVDEVRHVALGQQADVVAVVPATANTIAKIASGIADTLLGTTILASRAPLVLAPAMHTEMWEHAATKANISCLRERGAIVVGPGVGRLTGEDAGVGRLADVDDVVHAIITAGMSAPGHMLQDLAGRRILITAGGTREPLDPVRFLGNRSSGRQGVALAERARARGAEVTLVGANLEVAPPRGVEFVPVETAAEMHTVCMERASTFDIIIMSAAVADYRPVDVSDRKITKEQTGETFSLELTKNPDTLHELAARKLPHQLVVGFAAETEADDAALLERGQAKLARKGCDLLALNRVGWHEGFQREDNEVHLLARGGELVARHAGNKMSVADVILDALAQHIPVSRAQAHDGHES